MNFTEYQIEASKTIPTDFNRETMIDNAVYGLAGEVGEVVDLLKKVKFQGHKADLNKLVYELGDILWYINEMAVGIGCPIEQVAEMNIQKLRQRYGEKFDSQKSINRKDEM